ncbi:pitrilysin family protein [Pontibacter sp. HSC-36F09]|uniref:M16 family metallopeptidase n=1 Tax=Pontibacter sp. HSC-36F09 TaxID=2910966 RepID=UPI00209E329E|nr:M16 family metallopeptidase [Pontibacter sp. HSC-36F09]MCP2043331.1 putative Zn-dependent peptidase [Pontibacter sp. HSC-36F09]
MKKGLSLLLVAAAFTLTQCKNETYQTSSATENAVASTAQKEYKYETVPNDPLNARVYTLENGLKVYLTDYEDAPRVQTFIAVRAGSKNDPADATGLAHYLEHMVFKGTSQLGTQDWAKEKAELDKIEALYEKHRNTTDAAQRKKIYHQIDSISGVAASYAVANEYDKILGAIGAKGTNAYTSVEQTVYTNDVPSNQLDRWAALEAHRFGELVPRLFHTELEAVYEEKNRTLDNDGWKVMETLNAAMFPTHQYGTQTTIGTVEHLKNPSIIEIKKYFDKYYVPNNMAVALSGDIDFDETIRMIDEHFGKLKPSTAPSFTVAQEKPIAQPIVKEVSGPSAENVSIAYRFPGMSSRDAQVLSMISAILYNGQAGLIDLNLNQQQKVLQAYGYDNQMKDYSVFRLGGSPRQGQSLDQVKDMLLAQVELVKQGKFDDELIPAIVNDNKISLMRAYERNSERADAFVTAFIYDIPWADYVERPEQFAKITKQDVMEVANKYLGNNYVLVYKRNDKNATAQKVEKPSITPVPVNRDAQSAYYSAFMAKEASELSPVFVDYKADIKEATLKNNIPLLYTKNTENGLFQLYYILDMGTNNDQKLGMAVNYLRFLGTDKYTAEELKKEFYKLGTSFNVSSSGDQVYVTLSGLEENFEPALALFESVLQNPQPNQKALDDMVQGILKARNDAKLNKGVILNQALVNYAKYGPKNPFTTVLSEKELKAVKPQELVNLIKSIPTYEHRVLYYGPRETDKLVATLNAGHIVPAKLKPVPAEKVYPELDIKQPTVYWVDYNMVQAELIFLTKADAFKKEMVPTIRLYNQYFGAGMSSIVFQELRESKALAYSAYSSYSTASKKDRSNYIQSYIGTQSDKLPEAMAGMQELLTNMPLAEQNFDLAKASLRNSISSERITKSSILFDYERAKRLGLDYDIRKDVYESANSLTFDQLQAFQKQFVSGQPQAILVIGSKDRLNFKELEKYGKVKQLTLEQVFGY